MCSNSLEIDQSMRILLGLKKYLLGVFESLSLRFDAMLLHFPSYIHFLKLFRHN